MAHKSHEYILAERMAARNDVCNSLNDVTTQSPSDVEWVVFDNIHKAVYIDIPKCASTSWRSYFTGFVPNVTGLLNSKREKFRAFGINFTNQVPTAEINTVYHDYVKFVAVRHPLQRFVSGYYEVAVRRQKYHGLCRQIRGSLRNSTPSTCKDDALLNFGEFLQACSLGLLPQNEHWRTQQHQAHPCNVDLDYIFKTETADSDIKILNARLGVEVVDFAHDHTNQTEDDAVVEKQYMNDLTKYDSLLKSTQHAFPEAFDWLLGYFAVDMEMFGYTWDSVHGVSGCRYNNTGMC